MTTSVDLSESQAPSLAVVIILGVTLGAIAIALRLYTRAVIVGKIFLDDYLIVAGLVSAMGMAICMGISLLHGFGRHAAAITPQQITAQLKVGIGGVFFYHCSHMFVKSSILLQYIRICVFPLERRVCYAVIIFVVAEALSWIICLFLTCIPLRAMWEANVPGARCIDNTVSFYVCSATLISADLAILVIPAFLLRHSLLPWRRKLMLGIVLALGGAAIIASILRVRVIYMSTTATDKAWEKAPNAILGAIEVDLGLICSCVATLMPLLSRCLPAAWVNWYGRQEVLEVHKLSDLGSGHSDKKPDTDIESAAMVGKMDAGKKVDTAASV